MEISNCFNERCCGLETFRNNASRQTPTCIHGIVIDGKLEIKSGRDIYKMIDKDHSMYEHFYHLNDPDYLEQERLSQVERYRLVEEKRLARVEEEKRLQEEERLRSNYNNNWSFTETAELKICRKDPFT